MGRAAKIAVSLPEGTFKSLERIRRRLGTTRSAAVARAIEDWVRLQEMGGDDRAYVAAYLRKPERVAEIASIASDVTATWEPWR